MDNEMNTNNSQNAQQALNEMIEAQNKKKKKNRIIIISVVAVILLFIVIIASSVDSSDKDNDDNNKVSVSDNSDLSNSSSNTDEEKNIESGNSFSTKYLKISYISCDDNFKDYNKYLPPKKGNKIIRAEFEFKNISSSDQYVSGIECYADNNKCEQYFGTDDSSSLILESISPSRALKGAVYFEVPEDSKNIEIEIEGDFWTNEKVTFVIK